MPPSWPPQELSRNVRREVAKLRLLLQQYAVLAGQAQLFASDQAGKAARLVLVSTANAGGGRGQHRFSGFQGFRVAVQYVLLLQVSIVDGGGWVLLTPLLCRVGFCVQGVRFRSPAPLGFGQLSGIG